MSLVVVVALLAVLPDHRHAPGVLAGGGRLAEDVEVDDRAGRVVVAVLHAGRIVTVRVEAGTGIVIFGTGGAIDTPKKSTLRPPTPAVCAALASPAIW